MGMWRLEDNFVESVLPFYLSMGPNDWTQIITHAQKHLCPLDHLAGTVINSLICVFLWTYTLFSSGHLLGEGLLEYWMFAHLVSVDIAKQSCAWTNLHSHQQSFLVVLLLHQHMVLVCILGFCGSDFHWWLKVLSMLLLAYQLHGHPLLKELCKSSAHLKYVLFSPVDLKFIL